MEIWPEISLRLPTALKWAGTGPANLPGLAQNDKCPPRQQSAFPRAEAAAMDKSWGSGKGTRPLLKSWVTARNQDREEQDKPLGSLKPP